MPKLRFPEFDGAWDNEDLAKFLRPEFREVPKPTGPYLAIGVRSHGKGTFQKPDSHPDAIAMKTLFKVRTNDLIVNITFAWEGAIAIVPAKDDGGYVSHRFPTYHFDERVVIHEFFAYVIENRRFRQKLELISPGGAGRNRVLSKTELLKLVHRFPSPEEQKKIAGFLGAVDEKLAALHKKRDLLADYKRGVMQQIFSQTLRFTRNDGTAFPDWEERVFALIATRVNTKFNLLKDAAQPTLIEMENIEAKTGRIVGESSLDGQKSLKTAFHAGDVLFGKLRPYLEKFARPDFSGICSSEIWVLSGKLVSNNYLFYVVQSNFFLQLANMSTGSKMPRADWNIISDSEFEIPHPEEQQKIAEFLSTLDTKIDTVADQITQMEAFKKGLLQQMFV